jgi:hypothetical protein
MLVYARARTELPTQLYGANISQAAVSSDSCVHQIAGLFDQLAGAQLTLPAQPKPGGIVWTGNKMLQPRLAAAT